MGVMFPATLSTSKRNKSQQRMESGSCRVLIRERGTQLGVEWLGEGRMMGGELLRRIGIGIEMVGEEGKEESEGIGIEMGEEEREVNGGIIGGLT